MGGNMLMEKQQYAAMKKIETEAVLHFLSKHLKQKKTPVSCDPLLVKV